MDPVHVGRSFARPTDRFLLVMCIPVWDIWIRTMRIVAKRTLRAYWEKERRAEQPLRSWHAPAARVDWSSPADVKADYGNASIVGNDRVVFNIGGNRYRLVVRFDCRHGIGFVRFVGTHAEFDRIDVASI